MSHPNSKATPTPKPLLTATYSSPANAPFALSKSIVAPVPAGPDATAAATTATTTTGSSAASAAAVDDKSRYLEALRRAVAETQDQVNRELTARMDEDNRNNSNNKARELALDEAKEEENYGEDVQDDED
ncbi:hypothetical protein JDV02_002639 [Purpureocillium takamizusanense]|uniref:EKC/KEOPS complex subunit GON7 n=1 Tax=Purpureocillium takamizusanense TaxID=2060973 RepID=A0A9Q8V7M3_9HYPO|nr:uncharacterized protein JDV02_002639 [Purpureocillium takamizusanense]UNI16175.1 hypothetical protein JDV02_002639 [Purpureocillium takamizusanense]